MTSPDPGLGDEVARIKAIQDNAERLGLTWALRPATVMSSDPVEALVDGDTEAIGMQSMMGAVYPGDRVYVTKVPPSGNYIEGRASAAPALRARRVTGGTLATSTSLSAVTFDTIDELIGNWTNGAAVAVPVTTFYFPEDGRYVVTAALSLGVNGAAGSLQSVSLNVTSTSNPAPWGSVAYRGFWSVGENNGVATALVRVNAGDAFTVSARQNSTASTAMLAYLHATKVG